MYHECKGRKWDDLCGWIQYRKAEEAETKHTRAKHFILSTVLFFCCVCRNEKAFHISVVSVREKHKKALKAKCFFFLFSEPSAHLWNSSINRWNELRIFFISCILIEAVETSFHFSTRLSTFSPTFRTQKAFSRSRLFDLVEGRWNGIWIRKFANELGKATKKHLDLCIQTHAHTTLNHSFMKNRKCETRKKDSSFEWILI